ncbi:MULTISPECIES: septum formation initiator family protein [unclassified Lactobacillus]|uniref:FtsB family cell division protein n=1 Tax=unclassified Lactobacillus TaxID=2620435 RepID=UPI000EFBFCFB|nr:MULTISPECIES: septum formation initiator family protein [unclassified Lactobacillus]RMC38510.1 septum formation initiator family protein [Lactobacillus sp. ESL0237]RMC42856.1 septum formation initiator family protein [Lactobacillus sp. ESL0234]RMC43710.1 septum formation initiator family protein [Lactobacillus sp. ESL0236]RMC44721.1 septum formation initiator family protein [Lactobacillus sp. ESL0230]RMC47961.1 septum formation initiator family protein [Lactobacillus sp. ESL0225]
MKGPRIYNSPGEKEQLALLVKKQRQREKYIKHVHRVRRRLIAGGFVILFVLLGMQIMHTYMQTKQINDQVQTSKQTLSELNEQKRSLSIKRDNLKDSDYVAKLVRFKFLYSKPNETIYNLPEEKNKDQ